MVVHTSAGGPGGWFGLCSQVSDADTANPAPGMSTSSSWGGGRIRFSAELEEFMGRSFKVLKGVIPSIVGFYHC